MGHGNKSPDGKKSLVMRAKEVSFDTVLKMKSEIAILSSKILELNRSKEELETFYQDEIRKLIATIEVKNDTIDELKNVINK